MFEEFSKYAEGDHEGTYTYKNLQESGVRYKGLYNQKVFLTRGETYEERACTLKNSRWLEEHKECQFILRKFSKSLR